MKSILLASASIVAFAGAAAADGHASIGFAGDATLGYNDDVEDGFFWDMDLDITASAELDNGLTATATLHLDVIDNLVDDDPVDADDFTLTLSGQNASLSFGDVDPVAEDRFGGVDGAAAETFNDDDAHFDSGFDAILVGEVTFGATTAALSYGVDLGDANDTAVGDDLDDIDAMQLYITSSFGAVDLELAYQDEFVTEVFAISASTAVAGADITVAYVDNDIDNSLGLGVSYPVGPVTVGAYYTLNDTSGDNFGVSADYVNGPLSINAFYDYEGDGGSDADDSDDFGVEGSYDLGNGLTVLAGVIDSGDAYYAAGSFDLGGGATALVSFAEDDNNAANDEIGDPDYNHGTTVQVSFEF